MNESATDKAVKPLILLVDDVPANLQLLVAGLKAEYRLKTATGGAMALELLRAREDLPDLILLDVMMPDVSGHEVLQRVRQDPLTRHIPVIFLTADTTEEAESTGLALGADDFVTKPVILPLLLARVRNVVQREQLKREQLDALREQLAKSAKLASLGNLVASFAHDIGSPIANCVTTASTMAEKARELRVALESQNLRRSLLQSVLETMEGGIALTQRNLERANDLLVSFKQQALDQATAQVREIRLGEWVEELLRTMSPMFKDSAYRCRCEIDPALRFSTQPGPLAQVLVNLVSNALVHAFSGRDSGTIRIAAGRQDAQHVLLQVDDDGCGMTAEVRARALEPYFTTRAAHGGTGLGLDIVRHIVEDTLGGSLALDSAPGAGTRFRLLLPDLAGPL